MYTYIYVYIYVYVYIYYIFTPICIFTSMQLFTPAQNLSRAPTPALPPAFRAPLFPPPSPHVLSLVATLKSARPLDVAVVCAAVCCSVLQ